MITNVSSQTACIRANRKPRHKLMESTKKEIGCEPDSSGVVGLEGGGLADVLTRQKTAVY
jgi:histidinol phosphatase-like enzyme